jgi:hypothetical protein
VVQGILFAASAIGAVYGTVFLLAGWVAFSSDQTFLPYGTRVWAWVAIAAVPLLIAAFHGHKGLVPIAVAIAFVIALPWCQHTSTEIYHRGDGIQTAYVQTSPNLLAHALVAAFAVFLCWWGVRLLSRARVNLGIVGFAAAVLWFYFSDIYNDHERALGLIGLGVLFLAGGWALEKMRRRILARMSFTPQSATEAAAAKTASAENRGAQ